MSALTVLTIGVCIGFVLQAADIAPDGHGGDWAERNDAAKAAMRQHDYSDAAEDFGECVTLAATGDERMTALEAYGIALNRANRNAEAKTALEEALALREEAGSNQGRAAISSFLASVDRSLGDYGGAERVLRAGIASESGSAGERATLMVNLADILREQVRATEAGVVLNEASQLTGLSHEQQNGILVEQAELARDMHEWDASIALWSRIDEIARTEHSNELEAAAAGGLGETWFTAGNLTRAEPLLRRSLQLLRNEPGVAGSQLATALSLVARLYIQEDKLALAEEALDEAIEKDESSLGPGHPQVAMVLEFRADILSRRGETQAARDDLERARSIMSSHFGPESTAVAGVAAELGDVEQRAHRPDAAVVQYQLAMDLLRRGAPDTARFGAEILARYAAALKAAHRPDEARAVLASEGQSFRAK